MTRYAASYDPPSYEWDTYARQPIQQVEYLTTAPIRVIYRMSDPLAAGARARLLYCDAADAWVPATGYVAVSADGYYFTFNAVPFALDMHSAWTLDLEGGTPADMAILDVPFIRNTTVGPLADQRPFTALRRLEVEKHRTVSGVPILPVPHAVRVVPPTAPPYVGRVKVRAEITGKDPTTRLAENQLWCTTFWAADGNWAMRAEFVKGAKGDTLIVREQKYPYSAAVSFGGSSYHAGLDVPTVHSRGGLRTQSFQGYISQIIIRDNLSGFLALETGSRCTFTQFPGVVIPPGVTDLRGFHPGQGNTDTIWGWDWDAAARTWNYLGDFRLVPGVTRIQEPWQIAMCRLMPDGSLNTRSGFTQWVGDPLTGDLFAIDIYPRHPQLPKAIPADFMPAGYARPADATQPVFCRLSTNPVGTWGNVFRTQDQKLYYSNMDAQTITRIHHSGAAKEVILTGKKTLIELGFDPSPTMRLHTSSKTVAELRSFIVDGPLATASCIRPQFMGHDEDGTILFWEAGTFVMRRLDPVALTIKTFDPIPENGLLGTTPATWTKPDGTVVQSVKMLGGSSSSGTQDGTFCIDDGTIGAKGDVWAHAWGTTHRWDKDGHYLGNDAPLTVRSLTCGRADLCRRPTYSWGVDIFRSYQLQVGNDGYSQCKLYTPLRSSDFVPNATEQATIQRGEIVWNKYLLRDHGVNGYGVLGLPNVEEIGSWPDASITTYIRQRGASAAEAADFIVWARYLTFEIDYTFQDTTPPGVPTLTASSPAWSSNMYNIVLRATAPADADVAAIRFYADGVQIAEVPCAPGAIATFTHTHPGGADPGGTVVQYGAAAIDEVPNVSAQATLTATIPPPPDVDAPAAPTAFSVASITWVP